MDKLSTYEINESTIGKQGYMKFDDCTILFPNPTTNDNEITTACIEVFGRAIKATVFDDNGFAKYVFNHFADSQIEIEIIAYINDELFWLDFNNVIMLANYDILESLKGYIIAVENVYYSYYIHEYEAELSQGKEYNNSLCQYNDMNNMSGIEFEFLCKKLLEKMGFDVEQTKASGDGGIDLIATNSQPFLEGKYIIQCKRYSGSVGEPIIRDLYGVVCSERANKGILMTTGTFTNSAVNFAAGKQLELIDGIKLSVLLEKHQITNTSSLENSKINILELLENTLLFNIDEYNNRMIILSNNPNDDIERILLIKQLAATILGSFHSIEEYSDKLIIASEIKKQIILYNKHHNSSNKKTKYMEVILTILYIQLSIIEGNFSTAIKTYIELMNRQETCISNINKHDEMFIDNAWYSFSLYSAIYDAVQLASLTQNHKFIERIYQLGNHIIKIIEEHYSCIVDDDYSNVPQTQIEYAKKELNRLNNIKEINTLYFIDDYLIEKCMEWTYYGFTTFPYSTDPYKAILSNDTLFIQQYSSEMRQFARIDNINIKINGLQ